jgi:geranyl-CoA carboxylase alpha subunit
MLAKIIAHGPSRADAVRQLQRALAETHLLGVTSNRYFLAQCLAHPVFRSGQATTAFIAQNLPAEARQRPMADATAQHLACALLAAQRLRQQTRRYPAELTGWASSARYPQTQRFELDGMAQQFQVLHTGEQSGEIVQADGNIGFSMTALDGVQVSICMAGVAHKVLAVDGYFVHNGREYTLRDTSAMPATRAAQGAGDGRIKAPMNGRVVALEVAAGDVVKAGQTLLVLEAMKMEHRIAAPADGVVAELLVELGAQVGPGQVLLVLVM